MLLNFDIWSEIISSLKYPEDESTLRSLALTSNIPSGLALDAIWRGGERLPTIVSVINSFASSSKGPFLTYICDEKNTEERESNKSPIPDRNVAKVTWVLDRPLTRAARERTLQYLGRIRTLKVSQSRPPVPPCKEELLWPILSRCLNNPGPLLPNLRQLKIYKAHSDRIDFLEPFLPPALEVLHITTNYAPDDKVTLPALNFVKDHGCDLRSFTFHGGLIWGIPEMIALFKNLEEVQIPLNYPPQQQSPITIIQFLASLPSLRSLACNPAIFQHSTVEDKLYHDSLQRINVTSTARTLHELFRCSIFPSVIEAKISKDDFEVLGFNNLDSCFPSVQKLDLHIEPITGGDGVPVLDMQHLAPLLSLPMREFKLEVAKLNLTPADFQAISAAWPNLYSFRIWSLSKLGFEVLPSFAAFSGHPRLGHLDLNTRPSCLLENIANITPSMTLHPPRKRRLSHPCVVYLFPIDNGFHKTCTTTRAEKHALVEFLLSSFPNLKLESKHKLPHNNFPDGEAFAGLQEILLELRKEREMLIGCI